MAATPGVQRTASRSSLMLDAGSPLERAQRLLTRRSLVAFDLDKTVLHQGHKNELHTFCLSVCQTLIQLTIQRHNIAAVTGNDLHQLSSRFVKTLVEELCRHKQLQLLELVHLFCNCATVYITFRLDHPVIASLVSQQSVLEPAKLIESARERGVHLHPNRTSDGLGAARAPLACLTSPLTLTSRARRRRRGTLPRGRWAARDSTDIHRAGVFGAHVHARVRRSRHRPACSGRRG